jgi:hypothetical protein
MPDVGDLVRDDQMVLGIDRRLDVVAHDASASAAGGHGACIRVGQGDLPIGRLLHLTSDLVEALDLRFDSDDLVFETADLTFGDERIRIFV